VAGTAVFAFRPWVRSTCKKALLWGLILVVAVAGVLVLLERGERGAWVRAFGVLLGYSVLFWLTLAKIWWTAGRPALAVGEDAVLYQPLHTWKMRRIELAAVLAVAPRPGTEALRFVVHRRGTARELFLNLAVVKGRNELIELLGRHLVEAGLVAVPGRQHSWRRPAWEEPAELG
jgi:hypothetical protein